MKEQESKQASFTNNLKKGISGSARIYVIIALISLISVITLSCILLINKKTYNITFDSNGGSLVETVRVHKNDTIPKPEDPTKEGYVFAGWYYNDELYDFDTPVICDMTLKAKWGLLGGVSGVKLNYTELTLDIGDQVQLIATVEPEDANNKDLTWESSNPDVVSVDTEGNIKALKEGIATITVTTKEGGFTAVVRITVKGKSSNDNTDAEGENSNDKTNVKVTGVVLNKTSLTLKVGESSKLTATVKPSNATNKNVTWASSNSSVASVDSNGNIKALKEGTATITVTTQDGKYTATAKITVKEESSNDNTDVKVTGISLNNTTLTLTEGENSKLTATINPSNATNKNVTWSSSDSSVASVDENGNVKAIKKGTATITVTTQDGNYKATCQVTVNEKPASYTVTFTPITELTGVFQYTVSVTKNNVTFSDYEFIRYNETVVKKTLSSTKYNTNITSATIRLNDGTDVTATVLYK